MKKKWIYTIAAFFNFLVLAFILIIWSAGSHGQMRFRPQMTEDWILVGLSLSFLSLAFLFIYKGFKN